MKKKQSAKTA